MGLLFGVYTSSSFFVVDQIHEQFIYIIYIISKWKTNNKWKKQNAKRIFDLEHSRVVVVSVHTYKERRHHHYQIMASIANPKETAEKLRGKHIRTLEALQKVLDENKRLKEQLLQKSSVVSTAASKNESAVESVQIERLQFENSRLASQVDETGSTLLSLRRAHAKSEQQYHDQKLKFLKQINDLKTALGMESGKTQDLRHQVVDLEAQLDQQGASRRKQLLSTSTDLQKAEEELKQKNLLIAGLHEEIDELRKGAGQIGENKNNDRTIEDLEESVKMLKEHLKIKSERVSTVEFVNGELKEALEKMELESSEASKVKKSQRASYEKTIGELNNKIEGLKDSNRSLTSDLEDSRGKGAELSRTLDEMKKKLASLENVKPQSAPEPASDGGNDFPAFVKLKRENAILKAQLKDLMVTQKKMLGSAKRVNMHGGRRR